jgi:glycosyltransferase involved in cell wall biosynthesis
VRILYFADIRFPLERANGIQTMETCHALAVRGHEVTLAVRPDTHAPARDPFAYYGLPAHERLRIERAPVSGPAAARRLGYMAFAAGRAIGRSRADAIITRDLGVASMLLGIPRSLRAPLVYESHGYAPDVSAALPGLVSTAATPSAAKLRRLAAREARVWHGAEGYVTITAGLAEDLARRHGARRALAIVPDGTRPGQASTVEGPSAPAAPFEGGDLLPHMPVVAYAGHLYAWKGVDLLLQALALVPEAQGLIVGGHSAEPDLARVKALAQQLDIADRVTFTGLVDPARVPELLRRATVLALPNPASAISTRFTSPLKLFEYMAAGRPIVASDLPSIREVLHDNVDALLVPPGDPAAIAAAIRRLLEDRALAGRLAAAAREAVPQYVWDRRAERLERLLTEVTAAP